MVCEDFIALEGRLAELFGCGMLSLMLYASEYLRLIISLQSGHSYPHFAAVETEELKY